MPLGLFSNQSLTQSAFVAYIHYLSFMCCFGALILEKKLLKVSPNREEAIALVVTDVFYGIAALSLLFSGIFRVLYFGQGTDFYTQNPIFWLKVVLFISVGALSLYPTITYILWAIPLSKGKLPEVSSKLVEKLGLIINIELIGFSSIPLLATFMARGIGI